MGVQMDNIKIFLNLCLNAYEPILQFLEAKEIMTKATQQFGAFYQTNIISILNDSLTERQMYGSNVYRRVGKRGGRIYFIGWTCYKGWGW